MKWFNDQKRFRLITPNNGGEDLFVHQSPIQSKGIWGFGESKNVKFQLWSRGHLIVTWWWITAIWLVIVGNWYAIIRRFQSFMAVPPYKGSYGVCQSLKRGGLFLFWWSWARKRDLCVYPMRDSLNEMKSERSSSIFYVTESEVWVQNWFWRFLLLLFCSKLGIFAYMFERKGEY